MGTLLASRIKNRRKELKMSQKELAEGICKQGQISRLENGEYTPGSEMLYKLAKKMKVSMDYFFDEQISNESSELNEFKKVAKAFISHRNYESLRYIFEIEKENSHRLALSDKIYMDWVGTLIDFYYYEKKQQAIEKLELLLEQLNDTDLMYLQISNTLFNFYFETNNLERFRIIEKRLSEKVNMLNMNTIEELELSIKFNFNLCRFLWLNKDIEQAIKRITSTIKLCKDYKSTYLLADLFLLLANVSEEFSDKSVVKSYFETAYFLYKLDDNNQMAITVEHYISDVIKE